jgi:hypothetical protein
MADTVAVVLTEAKTLLNDTSGILYPNEKLLPFLNKAYREVQSKLNLYGLQYLEEVGSLIPIPAGTVIVPSPADMVRPLQLAERTAGTTNQFTPMDLRSWEPDTRPGRDLRVWVWREETIYLIGATEDKEIRLRYLKTLSALSGDGSVIGISGAMTVLAARTAALASRFLGENPSRADMLDVDASDALDTIVTLNVRKNQDKPTRRQRTRYRVPN